MRKHFFNLFLALIVVNTTHSQTRGTQIAYIDMEYILQNVSNYSEANAQLEVKAQKWKQEIETKKNEVNKLKETLKTEKALLTKGLIEERETEIKFLENEVLELQNRRFGPNGDLITQKTILVKPVQDQVFTAIQDIAEAKKYDFVFDKSSDLTILFAANRLDISDQVLRVLNRAEKREELTKKQLADKEAKEKKEDAIDDNPALLERKKVLEEKKAARDKILEERKLAAEQKKKEDEEKRANLLKQKEAEKNGTISATSKKDNSKSTPKSDEIQKEEEKLTPAEEKQKQIEARDKIIEDRKKALEEKRLKTIQERDSIKKARIENLKQ
jgi:Skp family chaperone for outer membrane proteins